MPKHVAAPNSRFPAKKQRRRSISTLTSHSEAFCSSCAATALDMHVDSCWLSSSRMAIAFAKASVVGRRVNLDVHQHHQELTNTESCMQNGQT